MIQTEKLSKSYGNKTALINLDLRVEPGEILGFLGPNGAGKSTTVLMLTTLLPPTAGTARVAGYDVVHEGPKVRSAMRCASSSLRSLSRRLRNINRLVKASSSRRPIAWNSRSSSAVQARGCEQ